MKKGEGKRKANLRHVFILGGDSFIFLPQDIKREGIFHMPISLLLVRLVSR